MMREGGAGLRSSATFLSDLRTRVERDKRKLRVALIIGFATALGSIAFLSTRNCIAGAAVNESPDRVLAVVGGQKITEQQVDAAMLQQMLASLDANRRYDREHSALDEIIGDQLIDAAAAKAGMTPEQYVAAETRTDSIVTDDDVKKFYEQNKSALDARSGGKSFDQIKLRLISIIQKRREAELREQLIAKLKQQTTVTIILDAPRYKVASAEHPSLGPGDAPVTIVEFGDFQCPFCRAATYSMKLLRKKYGDKLRVVYMDFPLAIHRNAMDAARAAQCADRQGKFWQLHDAMFADQTRLAPGDLKATAKKVGLDTTAFDRCLDSHDTDAAIQQDLKEGDALGVTGTPTFFVDGRELVGALPPERFYDMIDDDLARRPKSASNAGVMSR
jgi:protein-disulfide isomerase